ncbi:hypothetical protein Btru_030433 [Bulinus truncatus]|nr:hypothetical protein Btru_030433 [Bulinus truncatus]
MRRMGFAGSQPHTKMEFSRNPACEDSVDRFNHTWLVYFFLFMAALTFFLPYGLPLSAELAHLSFVLFMFWYGVNVSGLIKTWQTLYQEGERGEQRRRDFTHVVSERLGSSRRLACGYVIYKAIICFISVLFILIVSRYLMPSIEMAQLFSKSSSYTFESLNLICEVPVRVFTNLHMYTIQCFFKQLPVSDMRADLSNDTVAASALKMYASILGALLFTFFIITTVNAVNLTVWMVKLCRNRCISGSKQTLSLDASLLVRLMEEHSDAVASKMMEDSLIRESPKPNAELTNETTDVV